MKSGLFLFLFTALLALCAVASTAQVADISYPVESFENYSPGIWNGTPESNGSLELQSTQVHEGKKALKLNWDFKAVPKGKSGFVMFFMHRILLGSPKSVNVWINADSSVRNTQLTMWFEDVSGEIYLDRQTVDFTGWKQVVFSVPDAAAWDSGDKNRIKDPPMRIFGLAVEDGPVKTGSILVDDMQAATLATPSESQMVSVGLTDPSNIAWGEQPQVQITAKNYAKTTVSGLKAKVKCWDTYYNRLVWEKEIDLPSAKPLATAKAILKASTPFGVYRLDWVVSADNKPIRSESMTIARMLPRCGLNVSPAENAYMMDSCPWGGVFWQCTADTGRDTGARWIRSFADDWKGMEPKPDVFDMSRAKSAVSEWNKKGISLLWLTCLYNQPTFRRGDRPDFAPAYGKIHAKLAAATKGSLYWFELGNEDNGPTKFLYTEVARNGAAGIHSQNPIAQVANSGTAFVDRVWLRMQAGRGLFNWLDAISVHPYTTSSSPEEWDVYGQAKQVVELCDELGGMKQLWTTEFGWPEVGTDPAGIPLVARAQFVPRHFLIGVAGGYEKHGLYAWDGHFGIYDNGRPFAAAASTQAMARLLEGYRFAGTLKHGDIWVVVWEKFGKPVLIAWAPNGTGRYDINVGKAPVDLRDLFGNSLKPGISGGTLTLNLNAAPQYVLGLPNSITHAACIAEESDTRDRMALHLSKTGIKNDKTLNAIAKGSVSDTKSLLAAISYVSSTYKTAPRSEVTGIQANLLRLLVLNARHGKTSKVSSAGLKQISEFESSSKRILQSISDKDLNPASLRWAISWFHSLDLERKYAIASKNTPYANILASAQLIIVKYAQKYLIADSAADFVSVWPYLYMYGNDGQTLQEKLRFLPGSVSKVLVRVNNYAKSSYKAEVSLILPSGWKCSPEVRKLDLSPGKNAETSFDITCTGAGNASVITARLQIPGKPIVEVPFNDIEIAAPVKTVQEPLMGMLPETLLTFHLTNLDATSQSGRIRLMMAGDTNALARADFADLGPNAKTDVSLKINAPVPSKNEWPLVAEVTLADGRVSNQSFKVDFAAATKAANAPAIDGKIDDWSDALPLHIDKEEYGRGSFSGSWSPEDCSGTAYLKWDNTKLYFLCVVKDQTFNQTLAGDSAWMQDSIQIGFASTNNGPYTEFTLAHTPSGDQVFRNSPSAGIMTDARLNVTLSQGQAIYEAAIPWNTIQGFVPQADATIKFDVAINDDDAVVPRRFLERFSNSIVYSKSITDMGTIRLLPQSGQVSSPASKSNNSVLFKEDFEEYTADTLPDTWKTASHLPPVPEGAVRLGAGRDGSKALVYKNTVGSIPDTYLLINRTIEGLIPEAKYELRAWVRGGGIPDTGGIIGMCSDMWGNESYTYIPAWTAKNEWQEVSLNFTSPASGKYNVVIKNATLIQELAIDDIIVRKIDN